MSLFDKLFKKVEEEVKLEPVNVADDVIAQIISYNITDQYAYNSNLLLQTEKCLMFIQSVIRYLRRK